MADNDLFRKKALDSISSPETLNEYIKITNPGVWVVLLAFLAVLVAVIVWFFLGSIPSTIPATGIIFPADGIVTVMAPADGKISDMRVRQGQEISPHDIIAVVPQNQIIEQILELKNKQSTDAEQISKLQEAYDDLSVIRSQVYGVVLSAQRLNKVVAQGEPIANIAMIEEGTNVSTVISYVDMDTAKRIQKGMEVQISPSFAPREEYGYMYGYVSYVGQYPVTDADILATVGDLQSVLGMREAGALVEVRISILLDANAQGVKNKAKWSNEKGRMLDLEIGTETDLAIVLKEQKPYEILL